MFPGQSRYLLPEKKKKLGYLSLFLRLLKSNLWNSVLLLQEYLVGFFASGGPTGGKTAPSKMLLPWMEQQLAFPPVSTWYICTRVPTCVARTMSTRGKIKSGQLYDIISCFYNGTIKSQVCLIAFANRHCNIRIYQQYKYKKYRHKLSHVNWLAMPL